MPPEEPSALVAVNCEFRGTKLHCSGARVIAGDVPLRVSWYTSPSGTPTDYTPLLGGVVFVFQPTVERILEYPELSLTRVGKRYTWRDGAGNSGLMFVIICPTGYTIDHTSPTPVEAKNFDNRLALFWLVYADVDSPERVKVEWTFEKLDDGQSVDSEVERVNQAIALTMRRPEKVQYDVALSFAGQDRAYVEEVATYLRGKGVKVFYDRFEEVAIWGENLYDRLSDTYRNRARFTVMFISKWYAQSRWTNYERQVAQSRAFTDNKPYILPARFDDTEIPTMLPTVAYISLTDRSPAKFAELILEKLDSEPAESS